MHNSSSDNNRKIKDGENTKNNNYINENLNPIEETEPYLIEKDKKSRFGFVQKSKMNIDDIANTILFITVFIGIWQLIYLLGIWPKISLPSPMMVAESFYELLQNNTLILSIGMTMYRLAIGFTISIVTGMIVGLAMVKFPGFGKTMGSFAYRLTIISKYCLGSIRNITHRIKWFWNIICCGIEFCILSDDFYI